MLLGSSYTPFVLQAAKMSFDGPAVALSVDRRDPFQALVSFSQGPPEFVDLQQGNSEPLPIIQLGEAITQLSCKTSILTCGNTGNSQRQWHPATLFHGV